MATNHTATAREGTPRAEEWLNIFGSRTVYLHSPEPFTANLPNIGEQTVVMLDVPSLTEDQREAMTQHLCELFGLDRAIIEKHLDANDCPIRIDDDLTIATQQPLTDSWF